MKELIYKELNTVQIEEDEIRKCVLMTSLLKMLEQASVVRI